MLKRGDILDGKYEILLLSDQGGMSKLWLAMDTHVNKQWAVKEIDKSGEMYRRIVDEDRTLREVEIQKRLDHPALARLVDIIDKEDALYIVTDYIEGDNLLKILKTRGIPSQETVVSWMLDVCDAMAYLHSLDPPIIYRDLKPSNIMLSRDQRIKIIDFGIAKNFVENTEDTQPLGTLGYASPEHHTKHTDIRSDIYTVGTTMYHLLTGKDPSKPPYYILPIRQINPDLSSGLEKIVEKATQQDPDERYQTDAELANALESYRSLELGYIENLEKKEKHLIKGIATGAVLAVTGLLLLISSFVLTARSYQGLVNTTPGTAKASENYIKAVQMSPGKPEAYEKLLSEYTSDGKFTYRELGMYMEVFESGKPVFSKNNSAYSDMNYLIGESILTYYAGESDNSARAKILQAEPFFSDVKEGEHVDIARNYVYLASFYRDFVLADSSLVVKGATRDNMTDFIDACSDVIRDLEKEEFSGRAKMKEIVYDFVINMIDFKASELHGAGISKARVTGILDRIIENPECSPGNAKAAEEALKSVDRGYSEKHGKGGS